MLSGRTLGCTDAWVPCISAGCVGRSLVNDAVDGDVGIGCAGVDSFGIVVAGAAAGWPQRPLKRTSSAPEDEASEGTGDGLRIAICAMASALSVVEEGEEGVTESELDSEGSACAGWTSDMGSLSVP